MNNTSHTWEVYEKKNKRKGLITSIIIHAALIALFFFFGLSSAFPPPVEGILINFGTMETGKGEQPSEVIEPATEVSTDASAPTPQVQEVVEQEVVTQDVVEAPAVKEPEKKKEEVKPVKEEVKKPVKEEEKKPVKEEPKVDSKSMYTGQESDENNPADEGLTYGPGDQGDPDGDPSSKNYYGDNSGLGNIGVGHDLAGRNLLSIPPIEEEYSETGKVSVSIKVDRNGKVLFAKYTQKGSTTTNQKLIKLAEEAAMQAKFSPNSKVAEEQFGTITFTFKLK
ncbi:MAG: hypothetical protein SH857_05540 [Chitinophagales bacterium]|nr:hypothetical protein [Chitinophagales bacterium]